MVLGLLFPGMCLFWHDHIVSDPNLPYLGTAIVSVGLGVVTPILDNRRPRLGICDRAIRWSLLSRRMWLVRRAFRSIRSVYNENRRGSLDSEIRLHGNGLTRLFHEAGTFGTLVSVTMTNRKWYVGYVAEAVNLEPKESCFRLLPVISGYRDKDSLKFRREVYYRPVYEKVTGQKQSIGRFVVTLSLKDVQDAREFDEAIYEDHFSKPR
ncbi:MAG TPA: hypothetical protein VN442_01830 [Bryobacteraceae bacterium]|nr:hypothetical protein [Bryobacteraceae bacterium]